MAGEIDELADRIHHLWEAQVKDAQFVRDLAANVRENDGRAFIRDLVLAAMVLLIAASQVVLLLIVRGMR